MIVVERNTNDRLVETKELFEQIKPLLDKGYSYNQAIIKVKKITGVNTKCGWFKDLIVYGEKKGYSRKDYATRRKGRPRKG